MSILDEWVGKAEDDYRGAVALNRRRREPLPDLVCFHCQQCAEKYLKAFLTKHGVTPPRVHDLLYLLLMAVRHDGSLTALTRECALLTPYSVDSRYPGAGATPAEAADALKAVRRLRRRLRRRLGL